MAQYLAFATLGVFVLFAVISNDKPGAAVQPSELEELRKLALVLIAALLPSDFLVRYGRNLLFQSEPEAAKEGAAQTPATTRAQKLAFAAFLTAAVLTIVSKKIIDTSEFGKINDVVRVLILALLPSDAGIRFARAMYYKAPQTPTPGGEIFKRI